MDVYNKLTVLSDSAKYDVACTSSGVDRKGKFGSIGSAAKAGICHSFSADGRCISLLKVLMTNVCIFDCKYCVNRVSNDIERVAFTPHELAELTINFYRRNYIEGLFLSSGVIKSPNHTTEQLIKALELLRSVYHFNGYIHVKAIPGADSELITRLGLLADRMSINIELPSQESLTLLAPNKTKESILRPMGLITAKIQENCTDLVKYRHASKFVPAGQSTQLIVGATPDTDHKILTLTEGLYKKYHLKRVFFSAYMPVAENSLLPSMDTKPPLLREHRLYQADWLLRFYGFEAKELLDEQNPNFNLQVDPKCNWALNHLEKFPLEINKAPFEMLLRVPGIGVTSAQRILMARRNSPIDFSGLKKIGVVLKRAQYFITCKGKIMDGLKVTSDGTIRALMADQYKLPSPYPEQLSFFNEPFITREDVQQCLTGQI
ncbi:putative DNA modification/repair radical SAM protein [Desulfosporosinus nitroreducens]|uniref:putative DNA modification/repair radical SAM protein n=1 Tax=Desulfosporosinus nitroreducens TaxID=2018668 RepID=UPI00207CB33A|nr:putative DNA modification/repair radical SAM protein [Desulfosporosinus nitroreducens]MCO1604272.1 putative DNA modification/repair radical SAM protein [Desulfosporosinus nitroreducens]